MRFSDLYDGRPAVTVIRFVHHELGYSNTWLRDRRGHSVFATVLTRGYAGRLADQYGAEAIGVTGDVLPCGAGGRRARLPGRAVAGFRAGKIRAAYCRAFDPRIWRSQLLTGTLTRDWGWLAQRVQWVMSWNGMAIYGAGGGAPLSFADPQPLWLRGWRGRRD